GRGGEAIIDVMRVETQLPPPYPPPQAGGGNMRCRKRGADFRPQWVGHAGGQLRTRSSRSLRLDTGVLDHLRVLYELHLDELGELLGRAGERLEPDIGDLGLDLGIVDDLAHLGVEPGDDVARRPGRREESGP